MSLIKFILLLVSIQFINVVSGGLTDKETFSPSNRDTSDIIPNERIQSESRGPKRARRRCTRLEKSQLVSKLLEIYSKEYEDQLDIRSNDVHTLLKHKFSTLDIDMDSYIDRSEFREFRNSIRSKTRNINCVSSLFRVIDNDMDKKITLSEWITFYTNRRVKSRRAKPSPTDWASSIAAAHGLSLLNKKSDKDIKADKEKELIDDELDFSGFNVESILFKPNGSESRQMMISRLKKMLEDGKVNLST